MNSRNQETILRLLLEEGPKSRLELAERMGLSIPSVAQNVSALEREGLVRDGGAFDSTGGRKARIVAPEPRARCAVGLDVTARGTSGVLIDLSAGILASARRALPFRDEPEYYRELPGLLRELLGDTPPERLLGVGISIPGVLSHGGDTLIYSHVLRVGGVPRERFSAELGAPCELINDAKAAAIAECRARREQGDAVYLSLSGTVGGAVVLGGKLQEGGHQHSGEFGHMTLVPDGKQCYCGQFGCVDAYCSAAALTGRGEEELAPFFAALDAGDETCRRRWFEYSRYLAVVVNNLRTSLDCEIILGGSVGACLDERRLAELRALAAGRSTFRADETADVAGCRCRRSAPAVGAAALFVERFLDGV